MAMTRRATDSRRGAALLTALTLLAIFSILGAGYLTYMGSESDLVRYDLEVLRARTGAESGVYAAMGDIHAALANGGAVTGGDTFSYTLPIFRYRDGAPEAREDLRIAVEVSVVDEQARLNLNHTPPHMLGALLGLTDDAVDALATALPEPGGEPGDGRRWLASPRELVTRGIVDDETFAGLDLDSLTTDSVPPGMAPAAFLNVNTIPGDAFQALLGIEDGRLSRVLDQRPFDNMSQLMNAAQRASETFPIAGEAVGVEALGFASRVLRLEAVAQLEATADGEEWRTLRTRRAEAVVHFPESASPRLAAWRTAPAPPDTVDAPETGEA